MSRERDNRVRQAWGLFDLSSRISHGGPKDAASKTPEPIPFDQIDHIRVRIMSRQGSPVGFEPLNSLSRIWEPSDNAHR